MAAKFVSFLALCLFTSTALADINISAATSQQDGPSQREQQREVNNYGNRSPKIWKHPLNRKSIENQLPYGYHYNNGHSYYLDFANE